MTFYDLESLNGKLLNELIELKILERKEEYSIAEIYESMREYQDRRENNHGS